jgi:hypothetical protein
LCLVQKDKYILRKTIGRWLATEMGRDKPLDSKLLNRTLTDLQTEGQIKGLIVTVPFAGDGSKSRPIEVVVRSDFVPDHTFADFIGKRARADERLSRQDGIRAQQQRAKAVTVPVMVNVSRLSSDMKTRQVAENGLDMLNTMKYNGYLYSKVLRARALHLYIWQQVLDSKPNTASGAEEPNPKTLNHEKGVEAKPPGEESNQAGPLLEQRSESNGPRQTKASAELMRRKPDQARAPPQTACRPNAYETLKSIRESLARTMKQPRAVGGPTLAPPQDADVSKASGDLRPEVDVSGTLAGEPGARSDKDTTSGVRKAAGTALPNSLDEVVRTERRPPLPKGRRPKVAGPSEERVPLGEGVGAGNVEEKGGAMEAAFKGSSERMKKGPAADQGQNLKRKEGPPKESVTQVRFSFFRLPSLHLRLKERLHNFPLSALDESCLLPRVGYPFLCEADETNFEVQRDFAFFPEPFAPGMEVRAIGPLTGNTGKYL